LSKYKYVDITYDTFKYVNSSNGSGYVVFSEQKDFIAYNVFLQGYDSSGNALFDQPLAITDDYISDKYVRYFIEIENLGFMIIYESQSWMTGNKIELVARDKNLTEIVIGGGVAANTEIRKQLQDIVVKEDWKLSLPPLEYTTDNAAMIGITAYYKILKKEYGSLKDSSNARLKFN
jgi:hypothetical protein